MITQALLWVPLPFPQVICHADHSSDDNELNPLRLVKSSTSLLVTNRQLPLCHKD